MSLEGDAFLDLVGSREDIRNFSLIIERLRVHKKAYYIGEAIFYLQQLAEKDKSVFPYRVIRALDVTKGSRLIFRSDNNSEMLLNPEIIICFFDKDDIPQDKSKIIV